MSGSESRAKATIVVASERAQFYSCPWIAMAETVIAIDMAANTEFLESLREVANRLHTERLVEQALLLVGSI